MWLNVIGQERVKRVLRSALENEKLPGAYLFHGPEGTGKDAAAWELAKAINCVGERESPTDACDECVNCIGIDELVAPLLTLLHAIPAPPTSKEEGDLDNDKLERVRDARLAKSADHYLNFEIEGAREIRVGNVRQLRLALTRSLAGGKRRIVMISEADQMNVAAQNAFLKTLEEPNPNTLIILTSSNPSRLLPTILSRCQEVRFDVLSVGELTEALMQRNSMTQDMAAFLARLSGGSYSVARRLTGEDIQNMRAEIIAFLRMGLSRSRRNALREIDIFLPRGGGAGKFLERRLAVEQRLTLLTLWLRDALALATGSEDHIYNSDQQDDLRKFVTNFGNPKRIIEAIRAVEDAQEMTRMQLQLRPVMLNLVMNLESALLAK